HQDASESWRELLRIAQQVAYDLEQARWIGVHLVGTGAGPYVHSNPARREGCSLVIDRAAHEVRQIDRLAPEPNLAARDSGDVEQIVHQACEVRNLPVDDPV